MAQKFLQPTRRGFRHPTMTAQMNGNIYNQPRMAYLGGYDMLKEKHGHFQNAVGVKKPGATIAK